MKSITSKFVRASLSAAALLALGFDAQATEAFALRYVPGIGGADMSAPLEPGTVLQIPLYAYHATLNSSSTNTLSAAQLFPAGTPFAALAGAFPTASGATPVDTHIKLDIAALLPRLTYVSTQTWLGANVGVTALLPLVQKKANVTTTVGTTTISNVDAATFATLTGGVPLTTYAAGVNTTVAAGAAAYAATQSDRQFSVGDLEVAPILRWNNDPDQILFAPTLTLPTGSYDASRAVNAGAGNFYTFRPTLQYSHIAETWDFGSRVAVSWNTRNKDTQYKSGSYLNIDLAAMHTVNAISDSTRIGLQGYVVEQLTRDSCNCTPTPAQLITLDKTGHVYGIGPSIAWIKGAGEMLIEGKLMREFAASDRPSGTALWLTLSMPL